MGVLLKNISDMRERGELCDIVVVVEKERFYVHKLVLAATSAFFHAMFTSEFREKDKSEIQLIGQTAQSFKSFLCHVYSGQVHLTEENIADVYGIAIYLQAEALIEYCEEFMTRNINIDTCFKYLAMSEQFTCSPVFDNAVKIIAENFAKLSESLALYEVNASIYKEVLRQEQLADVTEEDILETSFKWIDANEADDDATVEILQEIRWGLLELSHLQTLLQFNRHILMNEGCQKMVERAIRYLEDERLQPILGGQFSTPRGSPVLAAIGGDTGEFVHDVVGLGSDDTVNSYFWDGQNNIEPLPLPMHYRECNACVVVNNILFLVGGFQYGYCEDEDTDIVASAHLLKYTPLLNRWNMLTRLSSPRCGHAAVSVEYAGVPRIMVIGGCSKAVGDVPSTVVYDIETDSWCEQDSFPYRVFAPAACVYEGIVYVSGGRDESQCKDFMYRFSPETRQWEKLSNMLYNRSSHSMCAVNDNIYIIGVYVHLTLDSENYAEMYSPKLDQYSKVEWIYPFFAEGNIVAHKDRIYRIRGECSALTFNTTLKKVQKNVFFSYSQFRSGSQESLLDYSTTKSALVIIHVPNETENEDELSNHENEDLNQDPYPDMFYQSNPGFFVDEDDYFS